MVAAAGSGKERFAPPVARIFTHPSPTYDRRAFMSYFSSIGLGATFLPGVLWAQAGGG
jgi:hypothetical protein